MNYFLNLNYINNNKKNFIFKDRRNRKVISNKPQLGKNFTRGDIITINFWLKSYNYHIEGLCLSIKNKKLINPNLSILIRNVLYSIGIEIIVLYYFNRIFKNLQLSDFKRKKYNYRPSKLYYIRLKKNKASKVK
jgi:ribosomal protein L19